MTKFIIAYDVADNNRLRKLAKCIQTQAVRVQRSVFIFDGTAKNLDVLMRDCLQYIDIHSDVLQSWRLADVVKVETFAAGLSVTPNLAAIVLSPCGCYSVEDDVASK